jgi:hypothetical protein
MAKREKSLPRVYGDPFLEEVGLPSQDLKRESTDEIGLIALGYFQELAARVKQGCSDEKLTDFEKRMECELFVHVVGWVASLPRDLALEFERPFRQVAEGLNQFPCNFPAHPESLRKLQKMLWDDYGLGKRNPLKLRPVRGRKTFSFETWVNQLLFHYYNQCYYQYMAGIARAGSKLRTNIERICSPVPHRLAKKESARLWLEIIWELLLHDIPEPETDPRLRQLGGRPSKVHDVRATIKAKLGTYLERMLNDQAVHK